MSDRAGAADGAEAAGLRLMVQHHVHIYLRGTDMQKFTPCLWFDNKAEEAARFYTSIFSNSVITGITHYGKAGAEASGQPEGSVMTVSFRLDGQDFLALNGGPHFTFSPAISFIANCESQDEVDTLWEKLSEDGGVKGQCGWLTDRYGVSWQIVPRALGEMLLERDTEESERVMKSLIQMTKLDLEALKRAANRGEGGATSASENSIKVSHFICADRKKVFEAWTDAELVRKWLCPEECFVVTSEAEVGVGGTYRESMQCGWKIHTVLGTYREIVPEQKLVFTHKWDEPEAVETVVVVNFIDREGGCEVTLTQEGFISAASAKSHEEGWASALRNLARQFPGSGSRE